MWRQWMAGTALAVVAVAAMAPGVASADPKTLLPITFDCGSAGSFTYAGNVKGPLRPSGELNGRKANLTWIWVEVAPELGAPGFIIAEWPVPRNPHMVPVFCEAHYIIPGDPHNDDPFDDLSVSGDATIYVRS